MSDTSNTPRVAVIGGGPGGYAAAFMAADHGFETTLINDEPNPGGVCLYRGCIPSKALLHVAKVIHESRDVAHFGVTFAEPKIDVDRLREAKEEVVGKMTGGLGQLAKARNVRYLQGRGSFVDSNTIDVALSDGGNEKVTVDYTIIATGSVPTVLPGLDMDHPRIWDSTGALELSKIPKKLLVVGGGYIGLELGQVYAALGSKVTVVEMFDSLLPGADPDLVKPLAKRCEEMFDRVLTGTKLESIEPGSRSVKVQFSGADKAETFDQVLVSIGRRPSTTGLAIENTNATVSDRGFVLTDGQRRTGDPAVFAIGDVAGDPMLAHKATHEARVAIEAIAGKKTVFEPNAIPAVVFTDPEVAWCGITEPEAKEQGREVTVAKFPWAASGRATTIHNSDGITKIIAEKDTNRVLGVGIAGPGAGEMIAEGVLAIEMAALAEDVAQSIHPHPTLSETVMESAEMIFGPSVHVYRKR